MQVAHPQSGSSSTWFLVELGIWKCWFLRRGETGVPREKTLSQSKGENQQQTWPTYGVDTRIWTQAALVGGECSHHCATLAPHRRRDRGGCYRQRQITPFEISIILHKLWKPNSMIVLLFIQNIYYSFKIIPSLKK